MKSVFALLFTAACFPQPQPQPAQQPQTMEQQRAMMMSAACDQNANTELAVCTALASTNKNANSGWELRGDYDQIAKTCPERAHTGPEGALEQCVVKLEAFELQSDPNAPQRREGEKPRTAATKTEPGFKRLIDEWMQALDGKNIRCRNKTVSDSDARECERWHGEMDKVEGKLTSYLEHSGYDRRDFRAIGLWPVDPNWRISPN